MSRLLVWFAPAAACGQCAMCFRNAAAQQAAGAQALNTGILVLLLPALALVAGFCFAAYRRRDS
ncbi:MAG: hypothetical protein HY235_23170 [Acidobacteria bacterium]|nr:hypothetical protein [Acidobacteriota bacterium]